MRYVRACHLYAGEDGELSGQGGNRITVGVDANGQVWLTTEVRLNWLGPKALAVLAGHLAQAAAWSAELKTGGTR